LDPGQRSLSKGGETGGLDCHQRRYGAAEADNRGALSRRRRHRRQRTGSRRCRGHRRRTKTSAWTESALDAGECRIMKSFNLSEWAINHRSFVWYLMLIFVVAGVLSFIELGREDDQSFSIKTMLVQTQWPGATIDDTMLQITERIEKKLQETPWLYYLKSQTKPGVSTIYVNILDNTPKNEIPEIWYQVRKKVADIKGT